MNLTVHYSLMMGLYWANYAVLMNYASVYLLGHGFHNTEIGILIAAAALLSALLQPVIGAYADKPKSPSVKVLLLILTVLFLIANVMIPFSAGQSVILLFIFYTVASMLIQCMLPLTNALGTVMSRSGQRVNFGIARGTGSLVYAIASVLIGSITSGYGIDLIPWISFGLYILLSGFVSVFPFQKQIIPDAQQSSTGFLKKYPSFLIVLLASVLLYSSHSTINNFMFQIISSKGGDNESLGIAFAIAAVTELPVMFAFSHLLRRISAGKWLVISGFAFLAKGAGTLLVSDVQGFYGVQLMQMPAYAVLTVASVYYTDSVMEPQDAVKGQALFSATMTAGSVIGSAAGGRLIDLSGIPALLVASIALASVGAVVMCVGVYRGDRSALPQSVGNSD